MHEASTALFPGSFDPPTLGHLDLIERGVKIFGSLWVGVASNPHKESLFTVEERVSMIKEMTLDLAVEVSAIDGLVASAAYERGVTTLLRGIRSSSDLDLEYPMAMTNRELCDDLETVCLLTRASFSTLSSRLLREVYAAGGELPRFLTSSVHQALCKKYSNHE